MHADTCFPKVYRPSFLPFEQTHVLGPEYHGDEYRYKHSHNAWLAQEYSFKASTLAMYEDYGAFALQWKLGGGCYLMTNNMNPVVDCDDKSAELSKLNSEIKILSDRTEEYENQIKEVKVEASDEKPASITRK